MKKKEQIKQLLKRINELEAEVIHLKCKLQLAGNNKNKDTPVYPIIIEPYSPPKPEWGESDWYYNMGANSTAKPAFWDCQSVV